MRTGSHRTLAIDPGTRLLGYAYFEGEQLWDYGVKQIRDRVGPRDMLLKVEAILARLIREKKPHALVLEKNTFSHIRQNARLTLAVYRIKAVAQRTRVRVFEYDPRTIRKVVCRNGNVTKQELARTVAVRFPELQMFLESDRRYKVRYWLNCFDAVATGLTYVAMNNTFSYPSA